MKVFLTERAEIVNAQDSDKDWYLTSWNKYTDTRVMPSLIIIKVAEILRKVCILICLNRCSKNQIFLRNPFFSNVVIPMFFY